MKGIGAGFGLIGLLLVGGFIFYMQFGGPGNPGYVRPAMEAKRETEQLANTLSGRDDKGAPVTESIAYEVTDKGILVQSVTPGGALDVKFGLKPGDLIVDLAGIGHEQFAGSPENAKAFMQGQYAREPWLVRRGNQRLSLPLDRNVAAPVDLASAPAAPDAATNAPATPAAPAEPRTNPQNQVRDLMKKIESH
jgi:hypothetical protein